MRGVQDEDRTVARMSAGEAEPVVAAPSRAERREARRDNGLGMSRENTVMLRAFVVFLIVGFVSLVTLTVIIQAGPPATSGSAGVSSGPVPTAGGWLYLFALLPLAAVIAFPAAIGLAVYCIFFAGRDRATFRHRELDEQERLLDAGDVLRKSLRTGPRVANTMTTRAGRRAGRAATFASWQRRQRNKRR